MSESMAELIPDVRESGERRAQYAEMKKTERDELFATVNSFIETVPQNLSEFSAFLNMQATLPTSDLYNTILTLKTMPGAQDVRTFDAWKRAGRSILPGTHGIKTLEREQYTHTQLVTSRDAFGAEQTVPITQQRNGYTVGRVFDVSTTRGATVPTAFTMPAKEDITASFPSFVQLAQSYGVKVYSDKEQKHRVLYDPDARAIVIRDNMSAPEIMTALTSGLVLARIHNREGAAFDVKAHTMESAGAAYVVCRSFGVDAPVDLAKVHAGLDGRGEKEIKAMLGNIGYHARGVGYELDKSLNPVKAASRYNFQNRQQDNQRNRRREVNRNATSR